MRRACVVLLILSGSCAGASAQQACPWLTEGTAAELLGGAVTATAHGSASEGSCSFVRNPTAGQNAETHGILFMSIVVGDEPPRECAQGEGIPEVGEDSTLCTVDAGAEHREFLRGRVRSTWFLLTLTASGEMSHDKASLRRALTQIGEEVAGNLF